MCSLRSALGARWGPSHRMMLWAFESVIVPSLTYRALVWGHLDLIKTTIDKLRQLNRLAAFLTAPVTPIVGLEVILGLKPLDLVAWESSISNSFKRKPRIRWNGIGFKQIFISSKQLLFAGRRGRVLSSFLGTTQPPYNCLWSRTPKLKPFLMITLAEGMKILCLSNIYDKYI